MADRAREQLVVAEALEEGRVVVVCAEHEAKLLEPGFALRAQDEPAVGKLAGRDALTVAEQAGEDAVPEAPGRVSWRAGRRARASRGLAA